MSPMQCSRCLVSECDDLEKPVFDESWVHHAVPGTIVNGIFSPEQCSKFAVDVTTNISLPNNECPAEWFSDRRISCNEWVFDPKERTIVNDVNILTQCLIKK